MGLLVSKMFQHQPSCKIKKIRFFKKSTHFRLLRSHAPRVYGVPCSTVKRKFLLTIKICTFFPKIAILQSFQDSVSQIWNENKIKKKTKKRWRNLFNCKAVSNVVVKPGFH